ncbi:hypothetical protein [Deinococcus radiophilus]|uniref:hypothetical protein n=1 Tax=Deinococcus radiophilus TaxID=32062 RepID=UPI0036073CA1
MRLVESPLIAWIWLGTAVMMLGTGLSLVSPRRPRLQEAVSSLPHAAAATD